MLPLNIIFLLIISLVTLIIVVSLTFNIRLFSVEKILGVFHALSPEYEFESCVTKFLDGASDLDRLCKICEDVGKKLKKSCFCFAVYSKDARFNECEVRCLESNNSIWLIKYSLPHKKAMIEC